MRKHLKLLLALFAAGMIPGMARAQSASASASVGLHLDLPVVLPQLVVVTPGVQVVQDLDQEVFFVDGFYWVRHEGGWYKSKSHRRGWIAVGPRYVPARIVGIPAGKYRRYKPARAYRPAPAPAVYRGGDRGDRYDHDRGDRYDRDHDRDDRHDYDRGDDHHDHGNHGGKHKGGKGKH